MRAPHAPAIPPVSLRAYLAAEYRWNATANGPDWRSARAAGGAGRPPSAHRRRVRPAVGLEPAFGRNARAKPLNLPAADAALHLEALRETAVRWTPVAACLRQLQPQLARTHRWDRRPCHWQQLDAPSRVEIFGQPGTCGCRRGACVPPAHCGPRRTSLVGRRRHAPDRPSTMDGQWSADARRLPAAIPSALVRARRPLGCVTMSVFA